MRPKLILVVAVWNLLACAVGIGTTLQKYDSIEWPILTAIVWLVCLMFGLALLDAYRRKPSPYHTLTSLLELYITNIIVMVVGRYFKRRLMKSLSNCQKTQADTLRSILKENKNTRIANDYEIKGLETVEDFRKQMPLTRYRNYETYVDLITEHGLKNVLFAKNVDYIALTSGTSKGKSKGYPKSNTYRNSNLMPWLLVIQNEVYSLPGCGYLKRLFMMQPKVTPRKSRSGIEQGPMSYFMTGGRTPGYMVVPPCPVLHEDAHLYVAALFGLAEDDLAYMSMITTSTTLALFKVIESQWERICADLEWGQVSSDLTLPDDVRQTLNKSLRKCPARAGALRAEFRKGFTDIARRVWPMCRAILAIRTGAFHTQTVMLRERYTGDLPIITTLHGSTESVYGLNLEPEAEHVRYTLLVNTCFFEFIPEQEIDSATPTAILAHQVEVGKSYELVVTTLDGLYRYRTEDIVQVTSFKETVPVYKFIRRAGDILSVNLDKIPEVLVYESVNTAARGWTNSHITDFTSVESVHIDNITGDMSATGFYMVFLEMAEDSLITEKERNQVDAELQSRHEVYAAMRRNGKLGPVRVEQVTPGTFERVKTLILQSNSEAYFMQYKLPRIVRRPDVLKLLWEQRCVADIAADN